MTNAQRYRVTLDDVLAARARIAAHVRRTPLVRSEWLSERAAGGVHLKLEMLQVTGSFKARGALNAALAIAQGERRCTAAADVVTASAGNHGRAVAWACERVGLRAVVFTPRGAPRSKTDAIRRHGAVLHDVAADYEEAERLAQDFGRVHDVTFVSPYDHPDVIAGAGTVALELLEDLPHVGAVVVPIGGGGLISGIAIATHTFRPSVRIVGVEVAASSAFSAARAAGRIVSIQVAATIADGLGGNVDPQTQTWPIVRDLVDDIVVLSESDLHHGLRELLAHEHLVTEGAGAAAAAAVRAGLVTPGGLELAVLLTGANIDLDRLRRLID